MHSILFIVNPISGSGHKESALKAIERYLDRDRFNSEIRYTEYAGHGAEIAREAAARGIDIVVAVGGDGTVNEIAASLVGTETALAIIPCGSGNGLARHLQIPMNPVSAVKVINTAAIARLDHGTINGRPCFCTCGVGFDAFISMKFAEAGRRGPATYVEKTLVDGLRYKTETYRITIGDEEGNCHSVDAFLIACANASQYGNNAYIAPRASMSDGLLDVIIMEPFDLLDAPQISLDMFNKTLDKNSKIKTFRCKELKIHRKNEGVIHFDGDPVEAGKDIVVSLKEKGINVIVNPDADKSLREPNAFQSIAASLFNELNDMRRVFNKRSQKLPLLGKVIQRKLTR